MIFSYLEDALTVSKITFGFELEGFTSDKSYLEEKIKNFWNEYIIDKTCPRCNGSGKLAGGKECPICHGTGKVKNADLSKSYMGDDSTLSSGSEEECEDCRGGGTLTCPDCGGDGTIDGIDCEMCSGAGELTCDLCDGSGTYNSDNTDNESFEWKSPPLSVTPENIFHIIKFLTNLKQQELITVNEQCGFHIHIKLPLDEATFKTGFSVDYFWILLQLAIDNNLYKDISNVNGIQLESDSYANARFLRIMKELFINANNTEDFMSNISSNFDDAKFVVFRLHPQGTLEWRGPRGFLNNDSSLATIKKFFTENFYQFCLFIVKASSTNSISNGKMKVTKVEFVKYFKKQNSFENTEKSKNNKFDKESTQYVQELYRLFPRIARGIKKSVLFYLESGGRIYSTKSTFIADALGLRHNEKYFILKRGEIGGVDLQTSILTSNQNKKLTAVKGSIGLQGCDYDTTIENSTLNTVAINRECYRPVFSNVVMQKMICEDVEINIMGNVYITELDVVNYSYSRHPILRLVNGLVGSNITIERIKDLNVDIQLRTGITLTINHPIIGKIIVFADNTLSFFADEIFKLKTLEEIQEALPDAQIKKA